MVLFFFFIEKKYRLEIHVYMPNIPQMYFFLKMDVTDPSDCVYDVTAVYNQ